MSFDFNFDFGSKKKYLIIGGAVILVLIILLIASAALRGSGEKEDIRVVELPAEEQILKDSYKTSKQITDNLNYTPYFITETNNNEMSIINAFEPLKIQVDCMNIFTIGQTKMSDVVNAIDASNKITVDTITEEIRAERQKAIDEKYEAEKKEAAEKGKEFTKEKSKADVSDLNYVTPYTYKMRLTNEGSENQYEYVDYQASYLLNPEQNNTIYLVLFKYSIPYVQFEFKSIRPVFNQEIKQEGDWRLTAVEAADCSYLAKEDDPEVRPAYVGEDLKCNAKNNIVMSGNIAFSGDGFAWSNTQIVTDRLKLKNKTADSNVDSKSSYEWSSDEKYAYYTIRIPADMFFVSSDNEYYYQPIMKLTATFDRTTQTCLNWRLEFDEETNNISREDKMTRGTTISVNIRDYKVDTQDYNLMQENVDNWIKENNVVEIAKQGYYLIDYKNNGKIIGRLDQGLLNVYSEVSLDGEKYVCVQKNDDGSGKYLKQEDYENMPKGTKESNEYINKNAIVAKPEYLFINEKDSAIAALDDINVVNLADNDNSYYIYSYDYNEDQGYSNVVLIDQPIYEKLPEVYQMFYTLTEDEFKELKQAGANKYAIGMKEYIQKLHPTVK